MSQSLLISAGEISGDKHSSDVIRLLGKKEGSISFFGLGGDALEKAGVKLVEHNDKLAFMGIVEVIRNYSLIRRTMRKILNKADIYKPKAALLIDYPGFNVRLAKKLKKKKIKVYYFISPKFWAWNYRRVKKLRKYVDHVLCIFPFEVDLLEKNGISASYVGNPLVDQINQLKKIDQISIPWSKGKKIALLPGSRRQEIEIMLPILIDTAARLGRKIECSFIIAAPNSNIAQFIRNLGIPKSIKIIFGDTLSVIKQADVALITSGTATLEAALLDTPHMLVYRTGFINYHIGRRLLRLPHVGLVNILAGYEVCPELLQNDANPESLAERLEVLSCSYEHQKKMHDGFSTVRGILGTKVCSEEVTLKLLEAYSAE